MLAIKTTVHVADCAAEPLYTEERDPLWVEGVELGGIRTLLAVPMLKENELIGAVIIYRQEVRPFTNKQRVPSGANSHVGCAPGHQQLSR
jgi:GAF domain-containing protein